MAFSGKVALITGAGSGMGQRFAIRMAQAGVKVAALDLNAEGLSETESQGKGNITGFPCDVTDTAQINEIVAKVETDMGPVDRAVTAAGIMPTALALDMDVALMKKILDVNVVGVMNVVKATLPGMVERGHGDQVMFASLLGWLPTMHFSAYCASKAAVTAFADVVYHENHKTGVRFTCVCPPMVNTPLLKQVVSDPKTMAYGKPLTPDQVIDSIEQHLAAGEFWCFPGKGTRWVWRFRRWMPGTIWKNMHKIEGI